MTTLENWSFEFRIKPFRFPTIWSKMKPKSQTYHHVYFQWGPCKNLGLILNCQIDHLQTAVDTMAIIMRLFSTNLNTKTITLMHQKNLFMKTIGKRASNFLLQITLKKLSKYIATRSIFCQGFLKSFSLKIKKSNLKDLDKNPKRISWNVLLNWTALEVAMTRKSVN